MLSGNAEPRPADQGGLVKRCAENEHQSCLRLPGHSCLRGEHHGSTPRNRINGGETHTGDLQRGRLVDYSTLPYNNGFGNTYRFTDELGGQTFTNNIIIDWSTWDGGTDVLGFIFSHNAGFAGITQDWATWISGQPYTAHTFTEWYVINAAEINNLFNYELSASLNGYPFYQGATGDDRYYTSTTNASNTSLAFFKDRYNANLGGVNKATLYRAMFVRTFTWDGASLT